MKLKYKFLITFLLISNIPIIIITLFTYTRYTAIVQDQTSQIAENIFEQSVEEVNDALSNIYHILEIFNFYSESQDSIIEDLKKYSGASSDYTTYDVYQSNLNMKFICKNLLYSSDYLNGIFVFTPSGEVLGYGYDDIDIDYGFKPFDENWYQEAINLKGKPYIDGISTKDFIMFSEPSISFSIALYDVFSHEFLGVLFIDCTPGIFNLDRVNSLPGTAYQTIHNTRDGNLLYDNSNEFEDLTYQKDTPTFKSELVMKTLVLHTYINYDKIYAEFDTTRRLIILMALMGTLFFSVLSFLISNYMTRPIIHLSQIMSKNHEKKEITASHYISRNDEIGVLYNEYNSMIEEINRFIKKEYQNKLVVLDSKMKSLEAQINSHFLYNTLESINSIAEIEEVETISIMSLALGNMFRYSIKTKSELVAIEDELNHVNDYFAIQKIRFNSKYELVNDIPPDYYSYKVLKLILQPIVENALYHGLQHSDLGKRITLSSYTDWSFLYIKVEDDGVGMTSDQLHKLNANLNQEAKITELGHRNKQSIGLKNIHSRIRLYYGQGYGISVTSHPGAGTNVLIKLPLLRD